VEADLAEIWAYVASEASEPSATRLLAKITGACDRLLTFPLSGATRDQLAAGLRVLFEGNYAAYYLATDSEVILVRVLHGARDAAAIAERGGFA
jgi:toxin ParE1/3/4